MATRLAALGTIIITTLLLTACGGSFNPVGTWSVDTEATKAELNDEDKAEFEQMASVIETMTLTLADGGAATLSMMGMEQTGTYEAGADSVTVTIDEAKTLTVQGSHLVMSEDGKKIFFKKK